MSAAVDAELIAINPCRDIKLPEVAIEETVNEVDGRLIVGDGKASSSVRTISLPEFILNVLADNLQRTGRTEPDDYVLQAPDGGPVRANNFRRRVYRPALKKAKLDSGLTFHRLRHSAGHHMRETGEPLEVIQKRLGSREHPHDR